MTGQLVSVSPRSRPGWLAAQLPPAMSRDRVIAGFVRAFEEIADSVREQVSDIEYELDVNLASPEMLSYLATWLGVEIDAAAASEDPSARDAQRRLIRAVGHALVWRGTRRGVEALLEALTDSRVDVIDAGGGVFGPTDKIPQPNDLIVVELDHTGTLTREQIVTFLAEELPVSARVELRVRGDAP